MGPEWDRWLPASLEALKKVKIEKDAISYLAGVMRRNLEQMSLVEDRPTDGDWPKWFGGCTFPCEQLVQKYCHCPDHLKPKDPAPAKPPAAVEQDQSWHAEDIKAGRGNLVAQLMAQSRELKSKKEEDQHGSEAFEAPSAEPRAQIER